MLQFGKYKMDTNERINQLIAENEHLKLRLKNQDVMITASLGVSGQIKKAAFELGYKDSMEATELDYLIETAMASVMVNQKNVELQSQLVAVQDSVVHGKCANSEPCATFCEAIATRKMFKQLQGERDALAAQANSLRIALDDILEDMQVGLELNGEDCALWKTKITLLLSKSPQHHLAAHDAEVAEKAVLEFAAKLLVNQKLDVIDYAKAEADQLRAKVGKQ